MFRGIVENKLLQKFSTINFYDLPVKTVAVKSLAFDFRRATDGMTKSCIWSHHKTTVSCKTNLILRCVPHLQIYDVISLCR